MGQSMGGAVVTLVGQTLQSSYSQINLQGIIFLCPAVGVPAPSPLVRFLLDQVIVPLFPHDSMPRWMASSLSDSATWENKHFIEYIKNDRFPENPHGLCWGKPLRFESARNILSLSELALDALPCINVPVLIFHDPNDKVVPYSCSEEILCKITVSLDHKKIINVDHGLHDLISNKVELISLSLIEWLDSFSQIK
jgi:alpha-beta hydrolase superfamily lysophospholipase